MIFSTCAFVKRRSLVLVYIDYLFDYFLAYLRDINYSFFLNDLFNNFLFLQWLYCRSWKWYIPEILAKSVSFISERVSSCVLKIKRLVVYMKFIVFKKLNVDDLLGQRRYENIKCVTFYGQIRYFLEFYDLIESLRWIITQSRFLRVNTFSESWGHFNAFPNVIVWVYFISGTRNSINHFFNGCHPRPFILTIFSWQIYIYIGRLHPKNPWLLILILIVWF